MKKILVTGGTGHLGLAILRQFVQSGKHQIFTTTRRPFDFSSIGIDRSNVFTLDLHKPITLFSECPHFDVVIHNASPNIPDYHDPKKDLYQPILHATRQLFEKGFASGIRRFIFISSASAIGFRAPLDRDLNEKDWNPQIYHPLNKAKAEAERWVEAFGIKNQCRVDRVAIPLLTGPGFERVTPGLELMERWAKKKTLILPEARFSLVDVRDVARLVENLVDIKKGEESTGRRWIAATKAIDQTELAAAILKIDPTVRLKLVKLPFAMLRILSFLETIVLGVLEKIMRKPLRHQIRPEFIREYYQVDQRLDSTRARLELNWESRPLEDSLKDTLDWLKNRLN